MSWGFRPALQLTGGSDPGGGMSGDLCPPIYHITSHSVVQITEMLRAYYSIINLSIDPAESL